MNLISVTICSLIFFICPVSTPSLREYFLLLLVWVALPGVPMNGPPMRIHVDPEAEGTVVTKQGKCPLQWEKVQQKFNEDLLMGIIEPYPQGKPPKWIHRAHYVRKPDGDIRRVIDLSPLNKHCQREVHGMQSPFELNCNISMIVHENNKKWLISTVSGHVIAGYCWVLLGPWWVLVGP